MYGCSIPCLSIYLVKTVHFFLRLPFFILFPWKNCFFFLLFRASPVAHGNSQARGRIRATVPSLNHSHNNAGSELHLQPTQQFMAMPDPNPLSKAKDRNCVLTDTSQIRFSWATTGTPSSCLFNDECCFIVWINMFTNSPINTYLDYF